MADENAVHALLVSVRGAVRNAAWEQFREKNPVPDLSQADLSNLEFLEADFRNCNLAATRFFNCDLAGADFTGANLAYADLRRANLANAFMTRAMASGIDLTGANLVDTNLDGADLRGAKLGGVHLVGASLVGADLRMSDLRGANLKFTNLTGAHLDGANVEDATLTNVELPEAAIALLRNADKAIIAGKTTVGGEKPSGSKLNPFESYDDLFLEQDCYKILGVEKNATLEEITKAYRQRAKEYHPDRVHNLGEKIRYVAGREFERIQHAYKSLSQHKTQPEVDLDAAPTGAPTRQVQGAPAKDPATYTLQDYVKLAKMNPNNEAVFFNLGVQYFRAGQYEKAIQAYQRCLKLNPSNKSAEYNVRVAAMMQALVQK